MTHCTDNCADPNFLRDCELRCKDWKFCNTSGKSFELRQTDGAPVYFAVQPRIKQSLATDAIIHFA